MVIQQLSTRPLSVLPAVSCTTKLYALFGVCNLGKWAVSSSSRQSAQPMTIPARERAKTDHHLSLFRRRWPSMQECWRSTRREPKQKKRRSRKWDASFYWHRWPHAWSDTRCNHCCAFPRFLRVARGKRQDAKRKPALRQISVFHSTALERLHSSKLEVGSILRSTLRKRWVYCSYHRPMLCRSAEARPLVSYQKLTTKAEAWLPETEDA